MKLRANGLLVMFFSSFLYFLLILSGWKTSISYFILLCVISYSILRINLSSLVSANTLFLAYFVYSVGLGPVFLLARGISYDYGFFEIILGGLLVFGWGNLVAMLNKKPIKSIDDKWKIKIISFRRIDVLGICYVISLLVAIYFLISNRVYLLGDDVNANRIAAQSGNGLILYIAQLPILIVPMMYDLYHRGKIEGIRTIRKYELVIAVVLASVALMFSGFRAPLMSMYICLAVLYIRKNKIKNIKIIGVGVVFVIVIEILGVVRSNLSASTATATSFIASFQTSFVVNCYNLKYVFDAFPSRVPLQQGYTYLINLIMLLPGPDPDFTLWLKDQLNLSFSGGGVTPTILGEFYINFGIIGIYVGMFLLGVTGVHIFRYFRRHSETFLGVFYVWQFAHCASGGIANVMVTVILYTIVYWGFMLFPIRKR